MSDDDSTPPLRVPPGLCRVEPPEPKPRPAPLHGGSSPADPTISDDDYFSLIVIGQRPRQYDLVDARGATRIRTTSRLLNKQHVTTDYVEHHGRLPLGLPPKDKWSDFIDGLLEAADYVERDLTETDAGALRSRVQDLLAQAQHVEDLDDLDRKALSIFTGAETQHVLLEPVHEHLRAWDPKIRSREVGEELRALGWTPRADAELGDRRRTVWVKPLLGKKQ